jgi:HNH endonuclease
MSYEKEMLEKYNMPSRQSVEEALLKVLFKHNGVIKEFSSDEHIVDELAVLFNLNLEQRKVVLERTFFKEKRIVKSPLWHRLLYRAAHNLANKHLITNPITTYSLTNQKEWMLTEAGFDKALELLNIPIFQKEILPIKSYEVQKEIKNIIEMERNKDYNPISQQKKVQVVTRETKIRERGFRQAVIEAYDYCCACCGLKLKSPNLTTWEVQAAHIVPHRFNGKDDILNGFALCRLHHWAFDVGWFTLEKDFRIKISSKISSLPADFNKIYSIDFLKEGSSILLPKNPNVYPHENAIQWHRENLFYP